MGVFFLLSSTASVAAPEPGYIHLEGLAAYESNGQLVLEYKVQERSWEWMKSRRLQPELVLKISGKRGTSLRAALRKGQDRLSFPLPWNQGTSELQVRVDGGNDQHRLEWMKLYDVEITELTLRVSRNAPPPQPSPQPPPPQPTPQPPPPQPFPQPTPPPQPPPPRKNWAAVPSVMQACGQTFDGQQNEVACLDVVSAFTYDPTSIIQTCDTSMEGDTNELDCVRVAAKVARAPSAALTACEQAMDGDTAELECFYSAVRSIYEPSNAIRTCAEVFDGDEQELECVRLAVTVEQDPSSLMRTCDQAMSGDEAEFECLERSLRRR
ncbi:hypothetical protein [Pyxidicoccus sp. MSG2]|uniref:hypothetical protein n=1 Tax=Pyxidicoccus sp. MSG2 TaxID=2996790 RepID=UPI0022721FE9|nr:hypothetical protein [Pyxidicoccus sp. MSG2]MCY1022510.1 hypothetical protein [Pyxidicoccus sp. MSG2]